MTTPLYQEVFSSLASQIEGNTIKIGEKLPPVAELTERFSVSAITIKHALNLLKDKGYVSRKPRNGTVVIANHPQEITTHYQQDKKILIGLVVADFSDIFGAKVIDGILREHADSVNIVVKKSFGSPEIEETLIKELIDLPVDGLILLPASSSFLSPTILDLSSQGFPIVVVDRTLNQIPISSVTTDNMQAAERLTRYLIENGHRKIGLLNPANLLSSVEERMQGFIQTQAFSTHTSLKNEWIQSNLESTIPNYDQPVEADIEKIKKFLKSHPDLTAVIAAEYNIALLIKDACSELGLSIPKDLSVACFDGPDNHFSKQDFSFTYIQQDQFEIGKQSILQLIDQIVHDKPTKKIVIPSKLIIGNSVRKIN